MRPVYLAAPFFNSAQVERVRQLEGTLCEQRMPYFSPRQQHYNVNKPDVRNFSDAKKVLAANVLAINACSLVLAVVDWELNPGCAVRRVEHDVIAGPPLDIPDSGTIWECGYAYAIAKPIVLFTRRDPRDKVNLMLTVSARGVCYGMDALRKFLRTGPEFDWNELEEWKGGFE